MDDIKNKKMTRAEWDAYLRQHNGKIEELPAQEKLLDYEEYNGMVQRERLGKIAKKIGQKIGARMRAFNDGRRAYAEEKKRARL